jgi:hypothetical protein
VTSRHPIDDATEIVDRVLNLVGPPPADPTETWRAALDQSTSAQLRDSQRALYASQQDLTAMQAQRDEARAEVRRLEAELGSALRALSEKETP